MASESETMRAEFEDYARKLQDTPPFDRITEGYPCAGEYASWAMERDWRIWQAAVASRAPSAEAKDVGLLRWVERCVNHHAHTLTPQEVLGMIQHHPSIEAITRSYADGVVPDTVNPWDDTRRLDFMDRPCAEGCAPAIVNDDDGRWAFSDSGTSPVPSGDGPHTAVVAITSFAEPEMWRGSIREAIDAAIAQQGGAAAQGVEL